MPVQDFEQFNQGKRWSGLAVFIAGKSVVPTAKDGGGFALVQGELFADRGDIGGVDAGGIDLLGEGVHGLSVALRFFSVEDDLGTGGAIIAGDVAEEGGQARLAEQLECGERQVRYNVAALAKLGLLEIIIRPGTGEGRRSNAYQLRLERTQATGNALPEATGNALPGATGNAAPGNRQCSARQPAMQRRATGNSYCL